FYDTRTGQETLRLPPPAGMFGLTFSPDGTRVALSGMGEGVGVYDTRTAQEAWVAPSATGLHVRVSPAGTGLLAGDGHGAARVLDARTGKETFALKGLAAISVPVFSPDGTRIVTAGEDGVVRLQDGRTGQELFTLKVPAGLAPQGPAFSP